MTSYFLRINTRWSNENIAHVFKNWLQLKIDAKTKSARFGSGGVWLRLADEVYPYVQVGVDVRMVQSIDVDDLFAMVKSKKDEIGVREFLDYMLVETHNCTHEDDVVTPCSANVLLEWQR